MAIPFPSFVESPTFAQVLSNMVVDHANGRHVCLVGPRGSGKSALATTFGMRMGYRVETFCVFADMSTRELLQSRGP